MKNVSTVVLFCALILAVMSCGIVDKVTNRGQKIVKTDDLWSDVPRMDGLTHSDLELPLTVKLVMRTALNNLWHLNKEGEDKTPVNGDWIVFSSSGPPSDVQGFYTNDRMTSFGNWEASKQSTCLDGKDKGINGSLCLFRKTAEKKEVLLAIAAIKDDDANKTNIFYLRLEKDSEADSSNKR